MIKIKEDQEKLISEFKRVASKNWIKNSFNSFGGIGNTFEKELGKKSDSMYFPDYYGIEIKCTSRYSRYPLYLFTVAFDGPTFPEIERIISLYGWPDNDFKDKKVLFTKLYFKEKVLVNKDYKFKLKMNEKDKKINLFVYNLCNRIIDDKSFIYLESLYNHLCLKLKKLAIIYASTKTIENNKYFRYYKIEIYELIGFEKFIELLKKDLIQIDLIARLNKSGKDAGRYRNKNLVFSIKKYNIEKLFKKTYSYDCDEHKNFQILK